VRCRFFGCDPMFLHYKNAGNKHAYLQLQQPAERALGVGTVSQERLRVMRLYVVIQDAERNCCVSGAEAPFL